MAKHISFKEYLESKEILKETIKENPPVETQYIVTKYCKIPIYDDGKIVDVKLKPRQEIILEWLNENSEAPLLQNLRFLNFMEDRIYKTKLKDEKLKKWVNKNITQGD